MNQDQPQRLASYRTIWMSDIHLGFHGCQAELIIDFLRQTQCQRLYLVGDIIDFWALKQHPIWPARHAEVIRALLDKAHQGTEVIYLPGNHDALMRRYVGNDFGAIALRDEVIHQGADGKRWLVLHGDRFDALIQTRKWPAYLGSMLYDLLLDADQIVHRLRRQLGLDYWSLAAYLKRKVKNAVRYIEQYEHELVKAARHAEVDGIISGHIHHADLRLIEGIHYANCGDWVESCTALVETHDGQMELIDWVQARKTLPFYQPQPVLAGAN